VEMKKWIVALSICTLLTCSILTITVAASEPVIILPDKVVYMTADHGTDSWFDFTITEVPSGYDITNNAVYPGWCVQKWKVLDLDIPHPVVLKSSYAPDLTNGYQDLNWTTINYIINHKQGSRESIQNAIWYFTDQMLVDISNDTDAQAMVNDAIENALSYTLSPEDVLAIAIVGAEGALQLAFLELEIPTPSLQGYVWYDANANGIQDAVEKGLKDVTVRLYTSEDVFITETQTNDGGIYKFASLSPGDYYLKFILLSSAYKFTLKDVGDDTLDSDADSITGKTINFTFLGDQTITIWDAGMYKPSSGGTPEPPEEQPPVNIRPTADATAGEPYIALIDQEILFNGSRSYDRDGTIVLYHWSFGDGTTANGVIVTHKYTTIGTYNVSLTVTDDNGATDTYTTIARYRLPNHAPLPPSITGSSEEYHQDINYPFTIMTTDPDNDAVLYKITWGDGTQDTTYLYTSGQNIQRSHRWTTWGFYTIQVSAQDEFDATSNVTKLMVAIDVEHVGNLGYLINTDGSMYYDAFYSNQTQNQEKAQRQQTGVYLLDTNGDGEYDQQYNPASKTFRDYPEGLSPSYTMLLVGLVVAVLLLLLLGFLIRRRRK